MPANRKPKKKYRPQSLSREDAQNAIFLKLREASHERLHPSQVRDLMIAAHSSLAAIETGRGRQEDAFQLAFTSNVALILAEKGMGAEFIGEVKEAQDHIMALLARIDRKESIALTGPGIQSLRRLLELHDAQVSHPDMTEGLAYRAVSTILKRMAEGDVLENPK